MQHTLVALYPSSSVKTIGPLCEGSMLGCVLGQQSGVVHVLLKMQREADIMITNLSLYISKLCFHCLAGTV